MSIGEDTRDLVTSGESEDPGGSYANVIFQNDLFAFSRWHCRPDTPACVAARKPGSTEHPSHDRGPGWQAKAADP